MIPYNYAIVWVLFSHWIADFIFQSRWMGNNKSSNYAALLSHIGVYMLGLTFLMGPLASSAYGAVMYSIVNGSFHLATDYVTSRVNKKLWNKGHEHWFWATIGFDQFLHTAVLVLTMDVLQW